MHARAVAATTTALLSTAALLLRVHDARADSAARPQVIAHRGASARAPENTLEAVDEAAALGVRWVENDVQRAKDGELVVIHDDSLRRTTDVEEIFPDRAPWKVKDFTSGEIARLDAGGWFSGAYAGARADAEAVPGPGGAQPSEAAPGDQESRLRTVHDLKPAVRTGLLGGLGGGVVSGGPYGGSHEQPWAVRAAGRVGRRGHRHRSAAAGRDP